MTWTPHHDNILRRNYPSGDLSALADRLGVTVTAVKNRAQVLGLHRKINSHRPWTERQMAYLRRHYADERSEDIAPKVGHSVRSIWQKAKQMGLAKSHEFFCSLREAGRQHRGLTAQPLHPWHDSRQQGSSTD